MEGKSSYGHYAALFSILVWGTTFVSTKVLLESFLPIEILFFRFVLGFIALILLCPHRLKGTTAKQELTFALAGLSGACGTQRSHTLLSLRKYRPDIHHGY